MERKDPKDMTAGELLRWAAENDKLRMRCDMCMKPYKMDSCGGHDCNDWLIDLADKIDAEIEEARGGDVNDTFMTILDRLITFNSYPSRSEGEGFVGWLERCFVQLPLDEDGEPVQFGDRDIDWDDTDRCPGTAQWEATAVDCRGRLLATSFSGIIAVAKTDENGRVKRPAPEVLGADGKPIVEGETVYPIDGDWIGDPLEVASIDRDGSVRVSLHEGKGWTVYLADRLAHTPPDTQEKIDRDKIKAAMRYWECEDVECYACPCKIDGKKPSEYYGTCNCSVAQGMDIARRQRELDARKGGE